MRAVPASSALLRLVLLALLSVSSTSVLAQPFHFDLVTSSLPWSPRDSFSQVLLSAYSSGALLLCGGSTGITDNDVWSSTDGGLTWSLQSGRSETANASGAAADASFPPTLWGSLTYDVATEVSFQWGGHLDVDGWDNSNATWYSTDGVNWAQAVYPAGAPAPASRDLAKIVATSSSARGASFLLLGGFDNSYQSDIAESALIWKSSAVSGTPGEREWAVTGSMLDAAGNGLFSYDNAVLLDQGRLDGKDILYLLGGWKNMSVDEYGRWQGNLSDEVWASSDEGATWAQLASSSFGLRERSTAAVTDSGILFVAGGLNATTRSVNLPDVWASFDGGYSWSLCTDALLPRQRAVLAYDPFSKQLLYGLGTNNTVGSFYAKWYNDLHRADVSDAAAVARMCGATIPAAGVGLMRWPGVVVAASSSTGAAEAGSSADSSAPTAAASSSSASAALSSSGGGEASSATSALATTSAPSPATSAVQPSSSSSFPSSVTASPSGGGDGSDSSSSPSSPSAASASSSSSTGPDNGGGGSGDSTDFASSGSSRTLVVALVVSVAVTLACIVFAYTQYRLRVYGTVWCDACAGVTCGALCGETVGWGTKWAPRKQLSDGELLKHVASDDYI